MVNWLNAGDGLPTSVSDMYLTTMLICTAGPLLEFKSNGGQRRTISRLFSVKKNGNSAVRLTLLDHVVSEDNASDFDHPYDELSTPLSLEFGLKNFAELGKFRVNRLIIWDEWLLTPCSTILISPFHEYINDDDVQPAEKKPKSLKGNQECCGK